MPDLLIDDPTWALAGHGLAAGASPLVSAALLIGTVLASLMLGRTAHAGAWVGLLTVVGSPSLRVFGLLFLLPAMLLERRELALISALLIASYIVPAVWLGVDVTGIALWVGRRSPALLEPSRPGRSHRLSKAIEVTVS